MSLSSGDATKPPAGFSFVANSVSDIVSHPHVSDRGSFAPIVVTQWLRYFFRTIEAFSLVARLFHPWKRERSPASHASRSPGVLRSQSGRISLVTARRSCQRSKTEGRPQNQ